MNKKGKINGFFILLIIIIIIIGFGFYLSSQPLKDDEIKKEIITFLHNWDCNGDKVTIYSVGEADSNNIYTIRLVAKDFPCSGSNYDKGLGRYKTAENICIIAKADNISKEIVKFEDGRSKVTFYKDVKYCGSQEYDFNETKFEEHIKEGFFLLSKK